MLKFVKEWIREKADNIDITEDGTDKKWTKVTEGLPSSDREVQILIFICEQNTYLSGPPSGIPTTKIREGKFNPHRGWDYSGPQGAVVAWRDFDVEFKKIVKGISYYDL